MVPGHGLGQRHHRRGVRRVGGAALCRSVRAVQPLRTDAGPRNLQGRPGLLRRHTLVGVCSRSAAGGLASACRRGSLLPGGARSWLSCAGTRQLGRQQSADRTRIRRIQSLHDCETCDRGPGGCGSLNDGPAPHDRLFASHGYAWRSACSRARHVDPGSDGFFRPIFDPIRQPGHIGGLDTSVPVIGGESGCGRRRSPGPAQCAPRSAP